jgi:hypothetical protein
MIKDYFIHLFHEGQILISLSLSPPPVCLSPSSSLLHSSVLSLSYYPFILLYTLSLSYYILCFCLTVFFLYWS